MERAAKPIRPSGRDNDFDHAVHVTRVILQMIGAWPVSRFASGPRKTVTRLQVAVAYFLFAFILIPGLLLAFVKERDFKRRVRLFAPLLNCWMCSLKYGLLVHYAKQIRFCLEQARRDWRDTVDPNDRRAMLSKARIGRKFAIVSAVFMYVSGLSYRTIVPLVKGRMPTSMNTTVRALACPSYFVKFDEQASPAYEIVFILQFFAGLIIYSVTCGAAGLAAFLVMHVCGQLSVLIGKLQRLNDMTVYDDRAVAILLADIVEHQMKVKKYGIYPHMKDCFLSFLKQIEEAMQHVWLVEIAGSTVLLCLVGYYIIMEWENSDPTAMLVLSVILISFTFSIFTICYVGQLLTDQSVKVGLMASTTDWHRLPHKRARMLILVMAISNIPARLSAGRMIEMSLPTFSNIIRTSMAYFNLLRKFIM